MTNGTSLTIKAVRQQLNTILLGKEERLQYIPIIDSTNTVAMKMAQEGNAHEGFVLLTDSQTAGRGRLGRPWVDTFGYNVLSSTVLTPTFPLSLLVMIASLAVVDAINDVCDIAATIKWPNDVLIEDRKVAGILIETTHNRSGRLYAVMGIGVNVYSYPAQTEAEQSLVKQATTLEAACGRRISRESFIACLLAHIEASYVKLQKESSYLDTISASKDVSSNWEPESRLIRERWRNRLSTLGRAIDVRQGDTVLSGIAEDVDDNGELFLRRHSGERVSITWGDIGYPTA